MDKYTKGELLGKGTFGTVIKATHKEVRRTASADAVLVCLRWRSTRVRWMMRQ